MTKTVASQEEVSEIATDALYEIAFDLYKNGKIKEAEKCFLLLTLQAPTTRKFWIGLGACNQKMQRYDEAIECYGVAAIQKPEDPLVHMHAANCFYAQGNEIKALETLKSAIYAAKASTEHAPIVGSLEDLAQLWSEKLGVRSSNEKKEKY